MPPALTDPYRVPGEYRKAQLHTHSNFSIDGKWSVDALIEKYSSLGFSFIFITDHDRVTEAEPRPGLPLVLKGEENTVPWLVWPLGKHMLRLFVSNHMGRGGAQRRIDDCLSQGGLVTICHPSWIGNIGTGTWRPRHLAPLKGYKLCEVYNYHSNSDRDTLIWHRILCDRSHSDPVWAVAVDDAHYAKRAGRGWIEVKVEEISQQALHRALENGNFYATNGLSLDFGTATDQRESRIWVRPRRTGHILERIPEELRIRFIPGFGEPREVAVKGSEPWEASYTVSGDEKFVRVEALGDSGLRAWSQPFWLL